MKILFVISHADAGRYVSELTAACSRKKIPYLLFFTGPGVTILQQDAVVACTRHAEEAFACEHAWEQNMGRLKCPVEVGSQTDHSRMIRFVDRLVSL